MTIKPAHNFKNLTGKKFGRLTAIEVISRATKRKGKQIQTTKWLCQCECGAKKIIGYASLVNGTTRSCGCLAKELKIARQKGIQLGPINDLSGNAYGRLTVIRPTEKRYRSNVIYECKCTCGSVRFVAGTSLVSGNTKSCGCSRKREIRMKDYPEYEHWRRMKKRCYIKTLPDYKHYGGRGIYVCERWLDSFWSFLDDMGPKPTGKYSIERKDNDGPYSPENCIWATQKRQTRNQRRTHWITFRGKKQSLADWAEELSMSYTKLRRRLNLGWPVEKAFTT